MKTDGKMNEKKNEQKKQILEGRFLKKFKNTSIIILILRSTLRTDTKFEWLPICIQTIIYELLSKRGWVEQIKYDSSMVLTGNQNQRNLKIKCWRLQTRLEKSKKKLLCLTCERRQRMEIVLNAVNRLEFVGKIEIDIKVIKYIVLRIVPSRT